MKTRWIALGVALSVVMTTGCPQPAVSPAIIVTVESDGTVGDVDVLDVEVRTLSDSRMNMYLPMGTATFSFPATLPPLDLTGLSGSAEVEVIGSFGGAMVASGTANTGIGGGTFNVTVTITGTGGATCGDGNVDPGEQCDDGNTTDGDGCSSACQTEPGSCGDGTCDMAGGETCTNCAADCASDPLCMGPGCGNGTVDPGEDCDGIDLGGETCASQGFDSGTLLCSSACTFDTSGCVLATCGDGVVGPGRGLRRHGRERHLQRKLHQRRMRRFHRQHERRRSLRRRR